MSLLLLGPEPFQKFGVGGGWIGGGWVGGWWSKGILELRFGPNLGLRLEAGTKLNNNIFQVGSWLKFNFGSAQLYFV